LFEYDLLRLFIVITTGRGVVISFIRMRRNIRMDGLMML